MKTTEMTQLLLKRNDLFDAAYRKEEELRVIHTNLDHVNAQIAALRQCEDYTGVPCCGKCECFTEDAGTL